MSSQSLLSSFPHDYVLLSNSFQKPSSKINNMYFEEKKKSTKHILLWSLIIVFHVKLT